MTLPDEVAYLDYRVRWRDGAARPGRHAMRQSGRDGEFRGYRPFWQCPDARQIDVRRSALEPSGDIMVRQTGQRSSINLVLAVDVSRSMQPAPERSALSWVVALAEAASRSALRAGDAFGMLGFDRGLREDVWLPPTRSRTAIGEVLTRLRGLRQGGRGADGMAELAERLPSRRCLVLLLSDFLVPLALIERALSALARHDVAPVVLAMDTPGEAPPCRIVAAGRCGDGTDAADADAARPATPLAGGRSRAPPCTGPAVPALRQARVLRRGVAWI